MNTINKKKKKNYNGPRMNLNRTSSSVEDALSEGGHI